MSHNKELKEGAFILCDAHYSHQRPQLLDFLKAIETKKLSPTQLIFMGDIFDTLFGGVSYTHERNADAIEIVHKLSLRLEIIYLEGNHDFNLSEIFSNVKVFGIKRQPLSLKYNDKKILLSHGDLDNSFFYKVYTEVVRSRAVVYFLNILDSISRHSIIKSLDNYLSKKNDCNEFLGFREFIGQRLSAKYSCDYFIEGHFHQNKTLKFRDFIYINLGAFACNQRYFIVKSSKDVLLLKEEKFSLKI